MIKNTELFYVKAKQYQDKRAQLVSDYEKKLESLKKYKGSEGYREDLEKLQKDHNGELSALQREYRISFRTILKGMENGLRRRKINPPSNDQLNLIHLLKMRKKVTEEDLDRVAEMVKDNTVALGVVQEIAHENGIRRNYEFMSHEMSTGYAQRVINNIRDSLEDWIRFDTSKAGRLANRYHQEHYGTPDREIRKRPLFEDKEGCFLDLAGLDSEGLALFSEAVDTE